MKTGVMMIVAGAVASVASAQSLTTVFGPGGGVGQAVPDSAVLNGIDEFTTFGGPNNDIGLFASTPNVGETLFFQVGVDYVGGAGPASSNPLSAQGLENLGGPVSNNRAYGVIGEGRSDIVFAPGVVETVTLQARGTETGQTTGSSPLTSFGGVPTDLADAVGTVLIWTEVGIEVTQELSNADFEVLTFDISALLGDSITRISIINEGPANSAAILGELTVTGPGVPAPGVAATAGLAGLVAARRRRA